MVLRRLIMEVAVAEGTDLHILLIQACLHRGRHAVVEEDVVATFEDDTMITVEIVTGDDKY
jgi:hypothetical protein